jgi:hypothetical protein
VEQVAGEALRLMAVVLAALALGAAAAEYRRSPEPLTPPEQPREPPKSEIGA